jgi:hypothetical protein
MFYYELLERCGVMDWNFKKIKVSHKDINLTELDLLLEDDSLWDEDTWRQEEFCVHQFTKTIPLIFDKDFRSENPSHLKDFKKVENSIETLTDILKETYGDGFLIRAILVKLNKNSSIATHIDSGASLASCKRVHIPIVTNKDVKFIVAAETVNMSRGEMWEINNSGKLHSVSNTSDSDRVHLILDWETE